VTATVWPLEVLVPASRSPVAVLVVEHPPVGDRVGQPDRACCDGVLLDLVSLAVDASELPAFIADVVLADEHLDLWGESQEAAVEVAGDPGLARVAHASGRLGGVVALVAAEEHDLGAVLLPA
jgi:hypothetical protein